MKNQKNILLILFIIIIIVSVVLMLFYNYYKKYEYYDSYTGTFTLGGNSLNNIINRNILDEEGGHQFYYDEGISGPLHSGTVNFNKSFSKTPLVFTQVNGSPDSEENIYSVNVSNITNNSFDYYKNVIYNEIIPSEEGDPSSIVKLSNDDSKLFNWFAF